MKKRTWIYVQPPRAYEVYCDLCNSKYVEWSEFEGHVWCWRCLKDTRGTGGVFSGPIPIQGAEIMGICFDRIDLKTGQWMKPEIEDDKVVYKPIGNIFFPQFSPKLQMVEK